MHALARYAHTSLTVDGAAAAVAAADCRVWLLVADDGADRAAAVWRCGDTAGGNETIQTRPHKSSHKYASCYYIVSQTPRSVG